MAIGQTTHYYCEVKVAGQYCAGVKGGNISRLDISV